MSRIWNTTGLYKAQKGRNVTRAPWGHISRHCVVCGKVGPRTMTARGWMHKRCMQQVGEKRFTDSGEVKS